MTGVDAIVVAQVTDPHLFESDDRQLLGVTTAESFQAVLKQIDNLRRRPDLLLLTGDLSQDGRTESYLTLKQMVNVLGIPTFWLPGNHDNVPAMTPLLNDGMMLADKSFEVGDWRFLLLNSQVPGCVHGCLGTDTLNWLDEQLRVYHHQPTLIALHHPPFTLGSEWLDGSALQNPEALFRVLDRHPQVKLVLFGHVHQEYSRWRRDVQYFGTPSTCIQFEPQSADFALDTCHPGFRILHLYPDATWWTTVERTPYSLKLDLAATGY